MSAPAAYRISPHRVLLLLSIISVTGLFFLARRSSIHAAWPAVPVLVYIVICGIAAPTIGTNFFLKSVHRGQDKKTISLTFDDGPHRRITPRILDILQARGVPATFFLIGKNAAESPELVCRILEAGHLIGNHSYDHSYHFDWQSARGMEKEINQTDALVLGLTGRRMKLFRPPYGVTNPMLAAALAKTGHYSIGWSLRTLDTRIRNREKLLNRTMRRLRGGDIILLHDTMPNTGDTLTAIIDGARARGFTFVPLDRLIPVQPYA